MSNLEYKDYYSRIIDRLTFLIHKKGYYTGELRIRRLNKLGLLVYIDAMNE